MTLIKSAIFAACLLFTGALAFAQTSFDTTGRLASIQITKDSIHPPAAILQETGEKIKEQVRTILLRRAQEAIRIINSNRYKAPLHKLYLEIWKGDSASLIHYLEDIAATLETGNLAAVPGIGDPAFNKVFNTHLSDTAMVFRWMAITDTEGYLVKKQVFASFITDYYNETATAFVRLPVRNKDLIESSYYLLKQANEADSLLSNHRNSLNKFRKTLYDSLRIYHANLTNTMSGYTKILHLLRNQWFKEWFWINGGEILINPLDLGIDTVIGNYVSDLSKIDAGEPGYENIFLEKRLDSLDKFFHGPHPEAAVVSRLINKVSIPSSTPYFQFSADGKIKYHNDDNELKKNIFTDQSKVVVIHNIPADRKAGLREDKKPIPNRSAFQMGLDAMITDIGYLAKAYGQVSMGMWSGVINLFTPKPFYNQAVITPPPPTTGPEKLSITTLDFKIQLNSYSFSVSGTPAENFLKAVHNKLITDGLLVIPKFEKIFGTESVSFRNAATAPFRSSFKKKLEDYLATITHEAASQVSQDSFMLAGLIQIYNKASTPLLKPINARIPDTSVYYSAILKTQQSDTTIENTVQPFTVKADSNTDSIFVGKFSYKMGKGKRLTLSAGIAYTLTPYDQSIAKAENGTISISNNNQLFRFVVGLNVYFCKRLFSLDDDLGKWNERWYVFAGVGIPKPVENLYIGIGRDIYPGLKATAGIHFAKHNKYLIQNNQIVEERLRYGLAGPFISLKIDPSSFFNLINVFKQQ